MARYDFRCLECETVFEEKRPMAQADVAAACPTCQSTHTRKLLNRVAFNMAGHDGASLPLPMYNEGDGGSCCGGGGGSCGCQSH
ncbi:MAG: zinc ribbon domain-containing protein [Chloroflexi bacterium]|nr:zinc ribbon domain-containing protein [Chloroflexota bacterium]MBP8057902.1 zinc ribbon domain-containing protein [Chloroflexota bacterium]